MKLVYIATMNVQVLRVISNDRFCTLVRWRHCCNKLTPCSNAIHSVNNLRRLTAAQKGQALSDYCNLVDFSAIVVSRQHLRSASQRKMIVIDWTVMVVGVSLLWARRPGIRCQTVFATQLWVFAFSGVTWKHTFLRNIDETCSAH